MHPILDLSARCGWALLLAGLVGALDAQVPPAVEGPVIQSALDANFDLLAQAPFRSTYQTIQIRRFLDEQGNLIQVRERLTVVGDGTPQSAFLLEFLDIVPPTANALTRSRWQNTYQANAGLLYAHGGFGVRDVAAARRNYTIHDFGVATRAGRVVRRIVVFPNRVDKAIWVLDLDVMTGIPLYSAEYDLHAQLLGEVEVTTFSDGSQMPKLQAGWQWKPRMLVTVHPSIQDAAQHLRAGSPVAPAVGGIMTEYVADKVQVTEDQLNGDQTLVLGYTDGIDEFFVLEMFGGPDPFAGSPAISGAQDTSSAHVIASYSDPALRAYVFHERGMTFQVVGRNSLTRLKDTAYKVCQQAITGS